MVFTNKYTKILIETFPCFSRSNYLVEVSKLYSDDKDGINAHAVFYALTDYVTETLAKDNKLSNEEIEIYKFADKYRTDFADYPDDTIEGEFDNAICTCFLENLINRASSGSYNFYRILPFLNEKSKEYCKAWDKFTGVRSSGLWTDQEWEQRM